MTTALQNICNVFALGITDITHIDNHLYFLFHRRLKKGSASVVSCVIGEQKTSPAFPFMISSPHRIHSCFQYTLGPCLAPEVTPADQNIVSQNSCLCLFLSRNRKQLAQLSDMEKAL